MKVNKNIYVVKTQPSKISGRIIGTIGGGLLGAGLGYLLNNTIGDQGTVNGVNMFTPLKGATLGSLIGSQGGKLVDMYRSREIGTKDDIPQSNKDNPAPIGNIKTNK